LLALLAACDRPQVERVELGDAQSAAEMALTSSPDSDGASWAIAPDGKGIRFGKEGGEPYLSLTCQLGKGEPPQLTIIRHAQSEPGAKALFAVLGNGIAARLKLDAALSRDGWLWQGHYPASAGELDVFTGPRPVDATLPGAGTLRLPGSPLPREFIDWCRRNGVDGRKTTGVSSPSPG
jgi:hypothetical protein